MSFPAPALSWWNVFNFKPTGNKIFSFFTFLRFVLCSFLSPALFPTLPELGAELSALELSVPEAIGEWKNVPRNVESFLITPIQRFPRYQLLLDGILKKTGEEHPDRAEISEALESVTELAFYFNNLSRMADLLAEDDAFAVLRKGLASSHPNVLLIGQVRHQRFSVPSSFCSVFFSAQHG